MTQVSEPSKEWREWPAAPCPARPGWGRELEGWGMCAAISEAGTASFLGWV